MRGLVIFAAFCMLSALTATLTNKQKFANKIINCGFKLLPNSTIRALCTCMETDVYKQVGVNTLTTDGMSCVMDNCGAYYASVLTLYSQMNTCLAKANTDALTLAMKIMDSSNSTWAPIWNTLQTKVTTWKGKKFTKAEVLDKAYAWGLTQFNQTNIEKYCVKLVNSGLINKVEWNCTLTVGKTLINFSNYACAKLTPAS